MRMEIEKIQSTNTKHKIPEGDSWLPFIWNNINRLDSKSVQPISIHSASKSRRPASSASSISNNAVALALAAADG